MQEITTDVLQIAYSGPALSDGRMQMSSLATGLRGQALLIHRVTEILYNDSVTIRVEIDSDFQTGSLIIPVHILSDGIQAAKHLLAGEGGTALANLLTILGFFGLSGGTLYAIFKKLKGRKIQKPTDVPVDLRIDIPIELLIRIYNDSEVRTQLRKTLEPLRQEGIEEFQTKRAGKVIESVLKSDLRAADEAELEDTVRDEKIDLGIEKAAWRRDLAWHFNDGRTSFDAKIEDDKFWKKLEQGEAFADGDRLKVHLRTTAHRTQQGTLKVQRVIPTVFEVEHVRRNQAELFEDENSE